MRKLGIEEIRDIALGAAVLGAGGGGDPYIGMLMAVQAVRDNGEITVIGPDEIPDSALVVPLAMMGAPTVLAEKATSGHEYTKVFEMISNIYGEKIFAVLPIEAGGVNSMMPLIGASQIGIPVIDVDGMGRAFPELQMTTFSIKGVSTTPMALADEKGNTCVIDTITNKWTENIARSITMTCGGSVCISLYTMRGKQLKEYGVWNMLTYAQRIGAVIRSAKECSGNPIDQLLETVSGYRLFSGKITDVLRETKGGFNFGKIVIEGVKADKGRSCTVDFQNENLMAAVEGKILCTVPDLISLVDMETLYPVTTDTLKYGKRVIVIGMKCDPKWRTPEGIACVGPRYFGYDVDYVPVEELGGGLSCIG